ncbi:hypothetical protein GCM10027567_07480 [Spongiibacter taiwanensis]
MIGFPIERVAHQEWCKPQGMKTLIAEDADETSDKDHGGKLFSGFTH